jgi:hypothetical protein
MKIEEIERTMSEKKYIVNKGIGRIPLQKMKSHI